MYKHHYLFLTVTLKFVYFNLLSVVLIWKKMLKKFILYSNIHYFSINFINFFFFLFPFKINLHENFIKQKILKNKKFNVRQLNDLLYLSMLKHLKKAFHFIFWSNFGCSTMFEFFENIIFPLILQPFSPQLPYLESCPKLHEITWFWFLSIGRM